MTRLPPLLIVSTHLSVLESKCLNVKKEAYMDDRNFGGTLAELLEVDMELEDCQSQVRRIRQRLVPRACWRAGERVANVASAE